AAPRLPYGVADVLKLCRAQAGEDVVVSYVQNSGTIYNLGPNEIVYLKNDGVSERVLNAMLEQRRRVAEASVQAPPPAQPYPNAQSAPVEAPVVPTYSSGSSVYVIPYSGATYAYDYYPYYSSYPYYYPYYQPY